MSKLFIESIGPDLYDICYYDDKTGEKKGHKENWEIVSFKTEKEAEEWLAGVEAERKREDEAQPFSIEEAEAFVKKLEWTFASTYAKTAPHEYVVKNRLKESDKKKLERFVATMKANSVIGYFYSHKNDYFILGDHYYWFMGQHENMAVDLINRTNIEYLDKKDDAYYYNPERVQEDIKKWEEAKKRQNESIAKPKPKITLANDEYGHIAAYKNGVFEGHVVTMETLMFHENAVCEPGNIIQHFKRQQDNEGNNYLYKVIGKATHADTDEEMMVYQALYGDKRTYVRPMKEYLSEVDHKKYPEVTQLFRFEYYNGEILDSNLADKTTKDLVYFAFSRGGFFYGQKTWIITRNEDSFCLEVIRNDYSSITLLKCHNIKIDDWFSKLKKIGINTWNERYKNLKIRDGEGWRVSYRVSDSVDAYSRGCNAYPQNWSLFEKLIKELEDLTQGSDVESKVMDGVWYEKHLKKWRMWD